MHPRNPHQGKYDFKQLCQAVPQLKSYLKVNPQGLSTIDFSDAKAVLLLNQALLKRFYKLNFWQIPPGYLCPPIPGRADYIHHLADLLAQVQPGSSAHTVLDIGTGANCIYPIIGSHSYHWHFVASDINEPALKNAELIIKKNQLHNIALRLQQDKQSIFKGVIKAGDYFAATLCNPPFYQSAQQAKQNNQAKQKNLTKKQPLKTQRNFSGQANELWCPGGELAFIAKMIAESRHVKDQVGWFTCLVSRGEHVSKLKFKLKKVGACEVKVIKMAQGNKISRFIAWRF